jgi:hypothetical protein
MRRSLATDFWHESSFLVREAEEVQDMSKLMFYRRTGSRGILESDLTRSTTAIESWMEDLHHRCGETLRHKARAR